jgi:uncharacterized membrane protein
MNKWQKISLLAEKYAPGLVIFFIISYNLAVNTAIIWKYLNFGYNAMDLGIINNVFYNSSLGNFFASGIHPPTYLGDHFSPILFFLLPFYFLWRHPPTFVFIQTLALSLSAWPIYLIAKNILGKNWGWLFALAWLINPYVQNVNLFEVSFLPLAVLFIIWAFYFYQKNRFWPFLAACQLALLVREDVALVTAVFALFALLDRKKLKWIVWPALISLAYFFLALKISSYFSISGSYKFLLYYSWLGNSLGEIIVNLCLHPWLLLPRLFSPGSLILFLALLLPTAYLALLRPRYLLLSGLIYLQLVSGVNWQWLGMVLYTQYSALLLPGIFLAWIFGVQRLLAGDFKLPGPFNFLLEEKILLKIMIGATALYGCWGFGPLASGLVYIAQNNVRLEAEREISRSLLSQIPPAAPVAASYRFLAPLSSRAEIYSFNYVFLNKQQFMFKDYPLPAQTQFLAIDFDDLVTFLLQYGLNEAYIKEYDAALANWQNNLAGFGLIFVKDNVALFQKGSADLFELVRITGEPATPEYPAQMAINDGLAYLGHSKTGGAYQLFWQAELPFKKNYLLRLTLEKDGQIAYQRLYSLGYNRLNSGTQKGEIKIQTNYWFEFDDRAPRGQYRAYLQVLEIKRGQLVMDPLRSTKNQVNQEKTWGQKIDLGEVSL